MQLFEFTSQRQRTTSLTVYDVLCTQEEHISDEVDDLTLMRTSVPSSGCKAQKSSGVKRYTLEDLERPVVTAAGALLDTDESALFNILSDIGEIKNKHLYPLFSFYLRQFKESIADYLLDPKANACEIDFWRGTMGYIYGERLCILAGLMFGLDFTVDRLRRLAEKKMGLSTGALNPLETDPLRQEERASHVQQVFNDIVRDHGHLADPEADSFFVIQRRKPRCDRRQRLQTDV